MIIKVNKLFQLFDHLRNKIFKLNSWEPDLNRVLILSKKIIYWISRKEHKQMINTI